ncbi:MAG: UDP-glucose 4-epimerase GalE [Firmicutes bacterium]|nr:UDP-glucose 4-epimerase GalE [Bacillota bacterium]
MRVLVTGGAGYIGSHLVAHLVQQGDEVTVVDNLRQGHAAALAGFPSVSLVTADIGDRATIGDLLVHRGIEAVYHLAASSLVSQSMADPLGYYRNNVAGTEALVAAMVNAKVSRLVFSSTAAVYGDAGGGPLTEGMALSPTNPYGETKWVIERMLAWAWRAHGVRSVCLRYFNAAGAHPGGTLGEDHAPETHLIPTLLRSVARGQPDPVTIYGTDYPTPDGTAIRDYIHVMDLAEVHQVACQWLAEEDGAFIFNVGSGTGYSVRQVVDVVGQVTGQRLRVIEGARRAGDPAQLIASTDRIHQELGWRPHASDLAYIVETAWRWHQQFPHGFRDPMGGA